MEAPKWCYEKLDEDGKVKHLPANDLDGKITGKFIFGLEAYFDENPDERIRLGWTKHLYKSTKDIKYNRQTQYLVRSLNQIDDYTIEDAYHVMDKSEEMMRLEEIDPNWSDNVITVGRDVWYD